MQIGEQLDEFKDRVPVLVDAVQLLHRRLAIDLLAPEQMAILHRSVQQKANYKGFNALVTKLLDYYQMETPYDRNDN
jgi:hypothetical protein